MNARPILIALALSATFGCKSANPYAENRLVLEQSLLDLEAGRYRESAFRLQKLLAETSEKSEAHALQRFFAAYLLTETHDRASHGAGFLEEPGARTAYTNRPRPRPSRLGHLMAMTYHSGFGRSSFEMARRSPLEHEGERKLPEELEELGIERACTYLNLCFLAIHAELDFQDRIDEFLTDVPEWIDLERCEVLMDEVTLTPEVRPWVHLAVFEYLKERDERNAYRFAIRARETSQDVEAFGEERRHQLAGWITEESSFQFVSPANQPFDPVLEGCTVTGTPNLMYEPVARTR